MDVQLNKLVQEYYQTKGESPFSAVLFLADCQKNWEELRDLFPKLSRGYFEISRLEPEDRVLFTRDFWLNLLPFHPIAHRKLFDFFAQLDDVGVFLCQSKRTGEWGAEMVYSLKDDRSFFRGKPPADEFAIADLSAEVGRHLPRDFLTFFRIHNGFGKLSEWGLLSLEEIPDKRRQLSELLMKADRLEIDPGSVIPFYESPLGAFWQCFYTDWYPGSEMGNVYLSGIDYTISDYADRKDWADQFAFPSFLEWFATFLEGRSVD